MPFTSGSLREYYPFCIEPDPWHDVGLLTAPKLEFDCSRPSCARPVAGCRSLSSYYSFPSEDPVPPGHIVCTFSEARHCGQVSPNFLVAAYLPQAVVRVIPLFFSPPRPDVCSSPDFAEEDYNP